MAVRQTYTDKTTKIMLPSCLTVFNNRMEKRNTIKNIEQKLLIVYAISLTNMNL